MAHARGRLTVRGTDNALAAGRPPVDELFAALPVAMLLVDPAGRIDQVNAATEQLLNLSERALTAQPLASVLCPPQGPPDRPEGHALVAYDTALELARGGSIRVDYMDLALPERPGWRLVTLHHTPGARRLGHAADQSAGARAAIGAAAMLGHEIRNPLSGIRGAAQLLATIEPGADRDELTALIVTEVDRIAGLIDRMQDFTDERPPAIAAHNIYPLLAHARQVALAGFASGIVIEEQFDPSLPDVLLDADGFVQVMINLLKNAAEALENTMEPGIVIATAYRHGFAARPSPGRPRRPLPIEVTVSDNGPGAPADIEGHLFEPFVTGKRQGRGLGLPMVEKLVGAMGGVVRYARQGDPPCTVFRILLPRADAA